MSLRKIVFATNNDHKLQEMRSILGAGFEVMSLADIGCHEELPETADTLEGNAEMKARYVAEHYGYDCFADDTGLFVEALDGAPGVYSARYAGEECRAADNVAKLMGEMEGKDDRRASFRTVIALVEGSMVTLHHGRVDGVITRELRGADGFGYDPVFQPAGYDLTFAQMDADAKNAISHRRRAADGLCKALKNNE